VKHQHFYVHTIVMIVVGAIVLVSAREMGAFAPDSRGAVLAERADQVTLDLDRRGQPADGPARVLSHISLEPVLDECEDSCILCPDEEEHACWKDAGLGGSFCQHDEPCTPFGSCEDHECDPDEQQQQDDQEEQEEQEVGQALTRMSKIHQAIYLISQSNEEDILEFVAENQGAVHLNVERRVVQFLGCADQTVAQAPLPSGVNVAHVR